MTIESQLYPVDWERTHIQFWFEMHLWNIMTTSISWQTKQCIWKWSNDLDAIKSRNIINDLFVSDHLFQIWREFSQNSRSLKEELSDLWIIPLRSYVNIWNIISLQFEPWIWQCSKTLMSTVFYMLFSSTPLSENFHNYCSLKVFCYIDWIINMMIHTARAGVFKSPSEFGSYCALVKSAAVIIVIPRWSSHRLDYKNRFSELSIKIFQCRP